MVSEELLYWQSNWWTLTMRGIFTILFGIACVFWPGLTLATFVYLFGIYILVAGMVSVFQGIASIGHQKAWFLTLLLGVLEVGVGIYLLRHPLVSFTLLVLIVAFSLIVLGIFEVVAALADETASAMSKSLLSITGGLAVLAGVMMLFQPASSGVAFVWIIGLFALISGPLWIALSIDVKNMTHKLAKS
ncbi:MAG: DUF308 domain-containing protein [Candidatus Nomurabacteria bacterium]|nr:MAG: DUF308 domain-containing protein [Candidatus Nomurabacteria bacterium]